MSSNSAPLPGRSVSSASASSFDAPFSSNQHYPPSLAPPPAAPSAGSPSPHSRNPFHHHLHRLHPRPHRRPSYFWAPSSPYRSLPSNAASELPSSLSIPQISSQPIHRIPGRPPTLPPHSGSAPLPHRSTHPSHSSAHSISRAAQSAPPVGPASSSFSSVPSVFDPQPQRPVTTVSGPPLFNHHLHLTQQPRASDWLDRPDSRSSSQSHLTALPAASQKFAPQSSSLEARGNLQIWTEEWPRQWSWTGVDIPVHGIRSLRDQVEGNPNHPNLDRSNLGSEESLVVPSREVDDPEDAIGDIDLDYSGSGEVISCNFASDRWKVEVVKAHARKPSSPSTPTDLAANLQNLSIIQRSSSKSENLSLYLTCHELEVDWPTSRSISASVLVSIKEPRIPASANPITDLGSPSEGWIWRVYCSDCSFERENEVWECHTFPSLSTLLENQRVAAFDSFILTIQIGTPCVTSVPQLPHASYVPHSLLEGLSSLLDDRNTSDLQILVTECDPSDFNKFRKRILYAHSNVLKSRSDYFKMMLSDHGEGGWAESGSRFGNQDDRRLGLIRIEDFDYISVYWLLHWLYTNRIFFAETEDVRAQFQVGASLSSMDSVFDEDLPKAWEWTTWKPDDSLDQSENLSAERAIDALETVSESGIHVVSNAVVSGTPRVAVASSSNSPRSRARVSLTSPLTKRRSGNALSSSTPATFNNASHNSNTHAMVRRDNSRSAGKIGRGEQAESNNPATLSPGGRKVSAHKDTESNQPMTWLAAEPHSHPIQMDTKPSALSIYRLAHRYELEKLQELSMTHLIGNLTPSSAFPLLLASFIFPDLHSEIKAYCLANYYNIVEEPEFRRCYAEVGEGLWEHGGEVLLSFTMSLMPGPW